MAMHFGEDFKKNHLIRNQIQNINLVNTWDDLLDVNVDENEIVRLAYRKVQRRWKDDGIYHSSLVTKQQLEAASHNYTNLAADPSTDYDFKMDCVMVTASLSQTTDINRKRIKIYRRTGTIYGYFINNDVNNYRCTHIEFSENLIDNNWTLRYEKASISKNTDYNDNGLV